MFRYLITLLSIVIFSQVEICYSQNTEEYIKKILDPEYPVYIETGNKDADNANYLLAMKNYARKHPAFPKFNNTGNKTFDEKTYNTKVEEWFKMHPYVPQYIDLGNKKQDQENYEKAITEWSNRYPDKFHEYKELKEKIESEKKFSKPKKLNAEEYAKEKEVRKRTEQNQGYKKIYTGNAKKDVELKQKNNK